MKQYFKYSNGYVNINEENIFMTNSGNWSEIHSLEEKSAKTEKANRRKKLKYDFYIFVMIVCGAFGIYNAINDVINKTIPIFLVGMLLGVYKYFQNEKGKRIKIPLVKIIAIEVTGNNAKIFFYNKSNEKDSEELSKMESKGLQILEQLNLKSMVE